MLRLKPPQRAALSETFRELANLTVGVLVLGQFVTGQSLSWLVGMAGTVAWFLLVGLSLLLIGERSDG